MLWFLFFAAQRKLVIESYRDDAIGLLGKNAAGKTAFTKVTLRPRVTWGGEPPSTDIVAALHHASHDNCFIASSVTCEVAVNQG
jgi:organic hydroperoxide reductase OsmC/OhrA